jgi:hypothetical protein
MAYNVPVAYESSAALQLFIILGLFNNPVGYLLTCGGLSFAIVLQNSSHFAVF